MMTVTQCSCDELVTNNDSFKNVKWEPIGFIKVFFLYCVTPDLTLHWLCWQRLKSQKNWCNLF